MWIQCYLNVELRLNLVYFIFTYSNVQIPYSITRACYVYIIFVTKDELYTFKLQYLSCSVLFCQYSYG